MICIYHSRDLDGYCSGAIVKKGYPEVELIGYDYGESFPWDKIQGQEVIMVDVSLPMEEMWKLANDALSLTWIDHHKSAIDDFQKTNISDDTNISVKLQVGRSACELAWEYFFPDDYAPYGVYLLGTYDVWRKEDQKLWNERVMPFQYAMRLACNSAESFPMHLLDEDAVISGVDEYIVSGVAILEYQKIQNLSLMKGAFETMIFEHRAICCNVGLPNFNSQAFASVFDESKHDIMVAFCYLGIGKGYRVSFYSDNDAIDVSVIAKKFLGGGHAGAAGCQVESIENVIIGMTLPINNN